MLPVKKILCPTDFSDPAGECVEAATATDHIVAAHPRNGVVSALADDHVPAPRSGDAVCTSGSDNRRSGAVAAVCGLRPRSGACGHRWQQRGSSGDQQCAGDHHGSYRIVVA